MSTSRTYKLSQRLKLSRSDMTLFTQGRKRCTIRLGTVSSGDDTITVTDGRRELKARVLRVESGLPFGKLTNDHALDEGFSSLDELIADLRHYYPSARSDDVVTIIYIEPLHQPHTLFD
jgi:hypothetical protein